MSLPGFTRPGGPVNTKELAEAWMRVYATLMIINSNNPVQRVKLERMQRLLAEVNEIVVEVLE